MKYTCSRGAPSFSRASTILAIQINVVLSVLLVSPASATRCYHNPLGASYAGQAFLSCSMHDRHHQVSLTRLQFQRLLLMKSPVE